MALGKAGLTRAEVQSKEEVKWERELRNQCLAFCARHDLWVGTAADHKKSTYTAGWLDLSIILPGRTLYIELKRKNGKLSPKQLEFIGALYANHHLHYVIDSYEEFLKIMHHFLGYSLK